MAKTSNEANRILTQQRKENEIEIATLKAKAEAYDDVLELITCDLKDAVFYGIEPVGENDLQRINDIRCLYSDVNNLLCSVQNRIDYLEENWEK